MGIECEKYTLNTEEGPVSKKPKLTPTAVRDLLLLQAANPNVIKMSKTLGLNYPIFLLDELATYCDVPSDFADPVIDLLIERQGALGFRSDEQWLSQAIHLAAWASLDQTKKLVAPCIARGPILGTIWLLARTKAPIDKEDMFCLATRVETKEESDKLCALVELKRPDLLEVIKKECEESLDRNDDIPF